jgi:hypothetical protein
MSYTGALSRGCAPVLDWGVILSQKMNPKNANTTAATTIQTAVYIQPFVHRNFVVILGCPVISGARELAAGVTKAKKQQKTMVEQTAVALPLPSSSNIQANGMQMVLST